MKAILVTGGCGFIGSHTCLCLLKNDYRVVVVDSNINSSKLSLENIKKIFPFGDYDKGIETICDSILNNKNFIWRTFETLS